MAPWHKTDKTMDGLCPKFFRAVVKSLDKEKAGGAWQGWEVPQNATGDCWQCHKAPAQGLLWSVG